MTAVASHASTTKLHVPQPKTERAARQVLRVLAVVDGSERTGRVIEHIRALASAERPIEVILLNVQPTPADGRLRGYGSFKREDIERSLKGRGVKAVTSAGRVLTHAGIEHIERVEIGDAVTTILRVAHDERCDLIVIGNPPPSKLQEWLLRSAGFSLSGPGLRVAQLADVTTVIVK
jgi:nucleotide-binding universal stress UspA family protein